MNAVTPPLLQGFGDPALPRGAVRGWDFLGNVPVPLRQRVRDGVADLVAAQGPEGRDLKCCLPMGQGGRGPFERLRFVRTLADFPDMLVSAEHGNAFNRRFYASHVEAGAFSGGQPGSTAPLFSDLLDPKGWVGVFAVAPFVLLIDRQKLNGLPVPRRWSDLTDPAYRGQVVFSGWRRNGTASYGQINLFFLLCMARLFGLGGVSRLLANVPMLMHSTQMPRVAGGGNSVGGVYVLPWSLASMCPRRDHTEVVWPEEGAMAYPLWLTVKESERRRLDFLVRHFYGPDLAAYLNHNRYPALADASAAELPENAGFTWPGWDFMRHRGTAGLIKQLRGMAAEALEAGSCG
ncbi:MAG TPA: ABC transporter substrate-binding protein [Candidatus Sulfotelmatobacter sp.]|jgi:ABC-type Fe3+ transport system substrate-binding protein|nr:ABC transporter substrate-binding protein [Candidatus Sulfotelmatobacter sp.]